MPEPVERSTPASDRIREHINDPTPSERRVARVLLAGSPSVGLESSSRLAHQAGVSGSTVSRCFVQRLGYENHMAFQQATHEDIAARVMSPVEVYRRHRPHTAVEDVLAQTGNALSEAVAATLRTFPTVPRPRDHLLSDSRRKVFTVGGWFSQVLAITPGGASGQRARRLRRSTSMMTTDRASSRIHPRDAKSASALLTVSRDAPTS